MNVKRWTNGKRILTSLVLVMVLTLTGCSLTGDEPNPLNPKGSVAEDQLWLIQLSLGIMAFVLVVVFALFFFVIIRYRKRRGQTGIPKQVEGNHKLEILWTVIPLVLLTILAVPTVQQTFRFAEDYSEHKDAVKVKVTAYQFWWQFEYPELGIVTAQDLIIPEDTKIHVDLYANDVAHSFWIPALAGKTDNLPGVKNTMYFDAKEPGVYKGKCAELCGDSHALMDFKVRAVTKEDFEKWVAEMKAPAVAADDQVDGAAVFKAKCMQCHAVAPDGASLGPNLNNFASRERVAGIKPNEKEWIAKWIADPQAVKPGTKMPQIPLEDGELDALVEYLQSLDNKQK